MASMSLLSGAIVIEGDAYNNQLCNCCIVSPVSTTQTLIISICVGVVEVEEAIQTHSQNDLNMHPGSVPLCHTGERAVCISGILYAVLTPCTLCDIECYIKLDNWMGGFGGHIQLARPTWPHT